MTQENVFLSESFLSKYKNKQPNWGFNGLGYFVYKRTYARIKESGDTEEWHETVARCVNGAQKIGANYTKEELEKLYDYVFNLKCNFGGRMLWQLGTSTVDRFGLASLLNCWFCSMRDLNDFCFVFEHLMLGGGVGFSVKKEDIHELPRVKRGVNVISKNTKDADFIVPDSRQGWVSLLRNVLDAYFITGKSFDYSTILIRGAGEPIHGFGGTASGPKILVDGIDSIIKIIKNREGKKLRSIDVLDINNIIGSIVVAGNVRRSAEVAIGDPDDYHFLRAKRWDLGNVPNWRAMSNNSIYADDFSQISDAIWEGYKGNGEPYGFMNLPLAKKYGRLGEERRDNCEGGNPCMEITLADGEACVAYNTPLITETGITKIGDSIGKKIKIWNGDKWSEVIPAKTGENQKLYRVHMSDGSYVDCNENHKFSVADRFSKKKGYSSVKVKDLLSHSKYKLHTHPFSMQYVGGNDQEFDTYTLGFAVGDGHVDRDQTIIVLYGEKDIKCPVLGERSGVKQYSKYNVEHQRVNVTAHCDPELVSKLKNEAEAFDRIFSWNRKDILKFIAGMIDSDGCNQGKYGIRLYVSHYNRAAKLQLLLTKCGIRSSVNLLHPKGAKTNKGVRTKDLYYLQITDCKDIPTYRVNSQNGRTPDHKGSAQFIKSIELLDGLHDVYCFTEAEKHMGVFNNTLTYQCNLAELYLNNIESEKELIECAKLLYKTQKAVWNLPALYEKTTKVVSKNRRIGLGVTGICQSIDKVEWLDNCYTELRKFDKEWSAKMNYPESIKLTTVKPSGTLSLLAGSTPGVHPAYSQYYIRRIRISSSDALVNICRDLGYNIEFALNFDGTSNHDTVVVSFPCESGANTILAKKMTAIDQLELVKKLQTIWSDNSVSVTVYYKKEELDEIKNWLKNNYENSVKTISFLLHSEHGFKQAPYEEIDAETYNKATSKVKPISNMISVSNDMLDLDECAGGACPIR